MAQLRFKPEESSSGAQILQYQVTSPYSKLFNFTYQNYRGIVKNPDAKVGHPPSQLNQKLQEMGGAWLTQSETDVTAELKGSKFEPHVECLNYLNK